MIYCIINMSSTNDLTHSASEQLTGRVKWFNNKAGYGFITVTDGPRSGSDIFVHHSTIQVENQQYKYLVQGEYVDFGISKTSSGVHEWQAVDVHGIKGGKLMCETRHEFKLARNVYKNTKDSSVPVVEDETPRMPRQQRARDERPRSHEKPRDGDKNDWTMVDRKEKPKKVRSKKQE